MDGIFTKALLFWGWEGVEIGRGGLNMRCKGRATLSEKGEEGGTSGRSAAVSVGAKKEMRNCRTGPCRQISKKEKARWGPREETRTRQRSWGEAFKI